MRKLLSVLAAGSLLAGCADAGTPTDKGFEGPGINLNIAALNLQGVGDVVWDLQVQNGDSETVWQQRISSSQYGNGTSASYVGPCDAGADLPETGVCTGDPTPGDGTAAGTCTNAHLAFPGSYATATTACDVATDCDYTIIFDENTVNVWVIGLYAAPVATPGDFGDAVPGTPIDFQNPTTNGPLNRSFTCLENQDVFVQFDVSLMRPAQQGFFDIAVNFNNIFCSAKFDCAYEAAGVCDLVIDANGTDNTCTTGVLETGHTTCTSDDHCKVRTDITLLHNSDGVRGKTFILGFACTAGFGTGSYTDLYMDNLTVNCSGTETVLNTSGLNGLNSDGNQCTSTATGMTCPAGVLGAGLSTTDYFQFAIYRGHEGLTLPAGTTSYNKSYWNLALGINRADLSGCQLTADATADDALNDSDNVSDKTIAEGTVYPFIKFNVNMATCGAEQLTFGDSNAMVSTDYTTTDNDGAGATYTDKIFNNNYDYVIP